METIHDFFALLKNTADNRDKGDLFERMIADYLRTDPIQASIYSDVWLWSDWPDRGNQPDTGIDIVAKEKLGGYCAVQCKCFDPQYELQKSDIDSFFTASGKTPFTDRLIVTTTNRWSRHAEEALANQQIPVRRLGVSDLLKSDVDWTVFSPKKPGSMRRQAKKTLRPHQTLALDKVCRGFKTADRGKLIMACGTGKTLTSLKIAEKLAGSGKWALFLVPSLSLLSQALGVWLAETDVPIRAFAVCSDSKVGRKKDNEDIRAHDLCYPSTTDSEKLLTEAMKPTDSAETTMTVIFSTYQSIQVIIDAQKKGLPSFDLVICDEAHRTTGVVLDGEDASAFVKVHDAGLILANKRLYMTATPRVYRESTKEAAKGNDALLCSMDDETLYGPTFHALTFSDAVKDGLLSDYRVIVLAVDETAISSAFQRQMTDENNELTLDDAVKIIGCWNALSKRKMTDQNTGETQLQPMRRAVAFAGSIPHSKAIAAQFSDVVAQYMNEKSARKNESKSELKNDASTDNESVFKCECAHVDGTFNVLRREEKLDWLKEGGNEADNTCRILSNVRCLSEGVDVPALDAVLFLNPRDSVVDVIQSVGRAMRKAAGKTYGYIILPVGIPAGIQPEDALKNHKKYGVIWKVLQALRSHDDRFNIMVNKIELNQQRDPRLQIIGVGGGGETDWRDDDSTHWGSQIELDFPIEEWRDAIYGRIVKTCGQRRYWETWAADIATIANNHLQRIRALIGKDAHAKTTFDAFIHGLKQSIHPDIGEEDAYEMLSQHMITKPVFDAVFGGYAFSADNPVSQSMEKIIGLMESSPVDPLEKKTLAGFYQDVQERAEGIDNAEGRQRIILELYENFFKTAFPKLTERLGIVYTPVEMVDFILKSADDILKKEFGVGISNENVHVLDPFTGTGTFLVRLLQSGLIQPTDLKRKYQRELHANEIVLLAYYIASINIEMAYHDALKSNGLLKEKNASTEAPDDDKHSGYEAFPGIVLTDTFQIYENDETFHGKFFPENSERLIQQKMLKIDLIIGNPPYSVGQKNENDNNKNLKYEQLDENIRNSYAKNSSAKLVGSLYDSYIRAIRWASDRVSDHGVIAFVTNGYFIDSNSADGLRKCLTNEFSSIYCFNLRGNQRTAGELSRKEGGKIFGSGSRTPVAITLLIKNPNKKSTCKLYYKDIGDYLTREQKLKIIQSFGGISQVKWETLIANEAGDWLNQRNESFQEFIPLGDNKNIETKKLFDIYSCGLKTNRDAWVYNFSRNALSFYMEQMIAFYNNEATRYEKVCQAKAKKPEVDRFIDSDPKKISWSRALKADLSKHKKYEFETNSIIQGIYRPYCKQWLYFNRRFNEMVYQQPKLFPIVEKSNGEYRCLENRVIVVNGPGATKEFSALIVDSVPNLHFLDSCQCFPLYWYESNEATSNQDMFSGGANGYVRKSAISSEQLNAYRVRYNNQGIIAEDIFYYVYGLLHSPDYIDRFKNDFKRMLPRIPFVDDFWAFSKAGRELSEWHLSYETAKPYSLTESERKSNVHDLSYYHVHKIQFGKKGKIVDKTTLVYSSLHHQQIILSGIPLETYAYQLNGKSALEHVMDRYQYKVDKSSEIESNPNKWSSDPRYILDLLKRMVTVSLETMKIVRALPPLSFD